MVTDEVAERPEVLAMTAALAQTSAITRWPASGMGKVALLLPRSSSAWPSAISGTKVPPRSPATIASKRVQAGRGKPAKIVVLLQSDNILQRANGREFLPQSSRNLMIDKTEQHDTKILIYILINFP